MNYPPHSHLVCLTFKGVSENLVSFCASALLKKIQPVLSPKVIASEAVPAPLARAKGLFRYQVMLRCSAPGLITTPLRTVMKDFKLPDGVTCSVDVDAVSLM